MDMHGKGVLGLALIIGCNVILIELAIFPDSNNNNKHIHNTNIQYEHPMLLL